MAKERMTAGPGLAGADPDQGQDARADDRADAKGDEVRPAKRLGQPMMLRHIFARDDRLADVPVLHSLPPVVIASVAKQSSIAMDCFVAQLAMSCHQ